MTAVIVRSAFAFLVVLSSASGALADVLPRPDPGDPSDPKTLLFGVAVVVAMATGIGYFLYRRRQK